MDPTRSCAVLVGAVGFGIPGVGLLLERRNVEGRRGRAVPNGAFVGRVRDNDARRRPRRCVAVTATPK